jgi:hypothetical protein
MQATKQTRPLQEVMAIEPAGQKITCYARIMQQVGVVDGTLV